MFDRIAVRAQNLTASRAPLDLGALVESMLFYQSTQLAVDGTMLGQLARAWTPEGVVELVARGHLEMVYHDNFASVFTERAPSGAERHDVVVGRIRRASGQPAMSADEVVPKAFLEATGKRMRSRRAAKRLLELIAISEIDDALVSRARVDILNSVHLQTTVDAVLQAYAPEYHANHPPVFSVHQVGQWLEVHTNIRFDEANAEYHRSVPARHSSLTPAFLMSHVVAMRETVDHAAAADAEMLTNPVYARVLASRFDSASQRRAESEDAIGGFQELVVDGVRSIREAVNKGRDVDAVLKLLKRADRFKSWIASVPAESGLVKEYARNCLTTTWAERLPTKTIRWALFTAAGLGLEAAFPGVGTAAGVISGALDSFLLDKLLKGWKPNQFVDTALVPFVQLRR